MNSLLPYFEHELSLFNKQSKEFAKKYPKIANRFFSGTVPTIPSRSNTLRADSRSY